MTKKHTELSNEIVIDAVTDVGPDPARRQSWVRPVFGATGLLVVALAIALWYQHRAHDAQIQSLQQAAAQAGQNASVALSRVQALESTLQEQSGRLVQLDANVRDSRSQVDTLVQAFQTLTDSGSDLVLLNDVDHLVTIAQQQLQLGGNVANAIVALETAQAQLARANRPALASLLQTINGDLERLRAVSTIDVALLTSNLDTLAQLVSKAPLRVPDQAAPEPVNAPPAFDGFSVPAAPSLNADVSVAWWERALDAATAWSSAAWNSISHDLGQFISVHRVDDTAAMLMSPDQAARFRENLRLRIMTAQLALMMGQSKIWSTELDAVSSAIEARFDERSPESRQALKLARQLFDTPIDTTLPSVANSLKAIEVVREEGARASSPPPSKAPVQPPVSVSPAAEVTVPAPVTSSTGASSRRVSAETVPAHKASASEPAAETGAERTGSAALPPVAEAPVVVPSGVAAVAEAGNQAVPDSTAQPAGSASPRE